MRCTAAGLAGDPDGVAEPGRLRERRATKAPPGDAPAAGHTIDRGARWSGSGSRPSGRATSTAHLHGRLRPVWVEQLTERGSRLRHHRARTRRVVHGVTGTGASEIAAIAPARPPPAHADATSVPCTTIRRSISSSPASTHRANVRIVGATTVRHEGTPLPFQLGTTSLSPPGAGKSSRNRSGAGSSTVSLSSSEPASVTRTMRSAPGARRCTATRRNRRGSRRTRVGFDRARSRHGAGRQKPRAI